MMTSSAASVPLPKFLNTRTSTDHDDANCRITFIHRAFIRHRQVRRVASGCVTIEHRVAEHPNLDRIAPMIRENHAN
jgi:hypothetical protein